MPKRSRLGWRTRLFRCLHFALSFVGIWLQSDWYSQGVVLRPGRLSSIVEVKREGPIFNSKEAAEEHGLKLCKEWIDKRP